jgi:hypothetical protein
MPQKKTSHGIVLKENSTASYVAIAQVESINGVNVIDAGEIDATTLDDTISPYMIPASVNGYPPITFGLVLDPNTTSHSTLRTLAEAHTQFGIQVVFNVYSTTKTWQCATGYISMHETGALESKTVIKATITYRPQAIPTFT